MKTKINKFKLGAKSGGFTIMETLVAIFILMLAITGPMVFVQNGLRTSFLARDQMTAFFLAQDAIEFIKNARDGRTVEIILNNGDTAEWLDGVNDGDQSYDFLDCFDPTGCSIDTYNETISSCPSGIGCSDSLPLNYFNDGEQSYFTTQAEGTNVIKSIFSRKINISRILHGDNDNLEAKVAVTIRWKSHEGIGYREIVVKENIFNWSDALLK